MERFTFGGTNFPITDLKIVRDQTVMPNRTTVFFREGVESRTERALIEQQSTVLDIRILAVRLP